MQLINTGTLQTGMRAPATGTVRAAHMATRSGRVATGFNKTAAVGGVVNQVVNITARPASRQGVTATAAGTSAAGSPARTVYDVGFFLGELRNRATLVTTETRELTADTERLRRSEAQSARLAARATAAREAVLALQGRFYDLTEVQTVCRNYPVTTDAGAALAAARSAAEKQAAEAVAGAEAAFAERSRILAQTAALEAAAAARAAATEAAVRAQLGAAAEDELAQLQSEIVILREREEGCLAEMRSVQGELAAVERAARLDPAKRRLADALAAAAAAATGLERAQEELAEVEQELAKETTAPAATVAHSKDLVSDVRTQILELAVKTLRETLLARADEVKNLETELRAKKNLLTTVESDLNEPVNDEKQRTLITKSRDIRTVIERSMQQKDLRLREISAVSSTVGEIVDAYAAAAAAAAVAARNSLAGGLCVADADLEAELARATDELRRTNDLVAAMDEEATELRAQEAALAAAASAAVAEAALTRHLSENVAPSQLASMEVQLVASQQDIASQIDDVRAQRRRIERETAPVHAELTAAINRYTKAAAAAERARATISATRGAGLGVGQAELREAQARLETAVMEKVVARNAF